MKNVTAVYKTGPAKAACQEYVLKVVCFIAVNETASPMFDKPFPPQWLSSLYSWPPTSSNSGAVTTTPSSATPTGLSINRPISIYYNSA